MKAYVDASPTKLCVLLEDGTKTIKAATTPHTNNEAEYLAVLTAIKMFPQVTEVLSDSPLVVNQLNGKFKVNKPELLLLWGKVIKAASGRVKFTWVPREQNPAGKLI